MYAAWGSDLETTLRDPALRDRLREAGATRLHVNVDDDEVKPAMRIPTFPTPIGAIVSVWTEGEAAAVTTALTPAAERIAGYEVEERLPIEPPEVEDGERTDALANMALLRRPEDLPRDEWLRNWLVDHTPVAIATQGTFGYIQNVVRQAVTDDAPGIDALVEELFPMAALTDIHAFYGSGGDDAELADRMEKMMASVSHFGADQNLDLVPTSRYCYDLAQSDPRAR